VDINAFLIDVTGEIDGFMYTYILLALLVATGIWYTIRTKAVQIRYIKDMFTQLTEKKHVGGKHSISSFQALMVSTASRVGTGNIAGVATAIATGGPGVLDVAYGDCRRRVGIRRIDFGADLQGSRQRWRIPRRPGLLHRAGSGQALAGRGVRRAAHPVLRVRLQRPAVVQCYELVDVLHR